MVLIEWEPNWHWNPNMVRLQLSSRISLTRKYDLQIKNEYNSKWRKLGKENHDEYDLQKFHQNDKVGIEQILDTYAKLYKGRWPIVRY